MTNLLHYSTRKSSSECLCRTEHLQCLSYETCVSQHAEMMLNRQPCWALSEMAVRGHQETRQHEQAQKQGSGRNEGRKKSRGAQGHGWGLGQVTDSIMLGETGHRPQKRVFRMSYKLTVWLWGSPTSPSVAGSLRSALNSSPAEGERSARRTMETPSFVSGTI